MCGNSKEGTVSSTLLSTRKHRTLERKNGQMEMVARVHTNWLIEGLDWSEPRVFLYIFSIIWHLAF